MMLDSTSADWRKRVLVVSLYHPELVRGGAQQVAYDLFQALRLQSDVAPTLLASVDDRWPLLFKSGARITGFDGRPDEFLFLSRDYDHWWHKTSSPQLVETYAAFLRDLQPEVVHFHHFFTLGIDLLSVTRRVLPQARIVFTFHEFMTICAADGQMVRKTDRTLCERPSIVRCHQCFPDRPPELFLTRSLWMQAHLRHVDLFTVPSEFMIPYFVEWGIPETHILHVPNGTASDTEAYPILPANPGRKNRFGFFGQFVLNKGLQVILDAVALLRGEGFTDFRVELNGDNLIYAPEWLQIALQNALDAEALLPPEQRVLFLNGAYQMSDLATRMGRIDWALVPSVWREAFGLVVSEAFLFGRPVICSDQGGPAERVRHEVDGLQVRLGDARALAETMKRCATEEGLWDRLHENVRPPETREMMAERYRETYGLTASMAA
jgi:glycosyltransferase involved in cell wall biosynthesis